MGYIIYLILMVLCVGVLILTPVAALAFFIVSLVLFIKTKIQQKRLPDSNNEKKAKKWLKWLIMLIVSLCLLAVSLFAINAILLGFYNSIAYM